MKKTGSINFTGGAIFVLAGAILPMLQFRINNIPVAPFAFSLGVVGILVGRYMQNVSTNNFRIKRLRIQQFISSSLLIISAYLMFIDDRRWILSLFIAAVIELVVALRMPRISEK